MTLRFEMEDTGSALLPIAAQTVRASSRPTTRPRAAMAAPACLAITKKIAGLMGGDVGVSSIEGQGSTFWFTAVLARAEQLSDEPAAMAEDGADRGHSAQACRQAGPAGGG